MFPCLAWPERHHVVRCSGHIRYPASSHHQHGRHGMSAGHRSRGGVCRCCHKRRLHGAHAVVSQHDWRRMGKDLLLGPRPLQTRRLQHGKSLHARRLTTDRFVIRNLEYALPSNHLTQSQSSNQSSSGEPSSSAGPCAFTPLSSHSPATSLA